MSASNARSTGAFARFDLVSASQDLSRICRFRRPSPRAIFGVSFLEAVSLEWSMKAERSALIGPAEWYALEQQLDGQDPGLAAFDDCFDNVRGQIGEPKQLTYMRIAEPESLRNLGCVDELTVS
jgi:hypothetical protein